jgi:hypothetical protein
MLTLAEAREKAAALRRLVKAGIDPVAERDRERKHIPTFAEAVTEAHAELSRGWADRTAKAFLASLVEHANPKLGALKVSGIGAQEIVVALAPIWNDKPVMARKVRARIGQVRLCEGPRLADRRSSRCAGVARRAVEAAEGGKLCCHALC